MNTESTLIGASLYLAHSRYPGISHERQLAGQEAQNVFFSSKQRAEDSGRRYRTCSDGSILSLEQWDIVKVLMHGISISIQKDDFPVIIFHIYLIYYKNALPHATFKTNGIQTVFENGL